MQHHDGVVLAAQSNLNEVKAEAYHANKSPITRSTRSSQYSSCHNYSKYSGYISYCNRFDRFNCFNRFNQSTKYCINYRGKGIERRILYRRGYRSYKYNNVKLVVAYSNGCYYQYTYFIKADSYLYSYYLYCSY